MDIQKRIEKEVKVERFGPQKLSYNEILEMELSKIKEYLGLLSLEERELVFSVVRSSWK